jgi:hypothetical protein
MVTIPRAEINAVGHRHGIDWNLDFEASVGWVRAQANLLRAESPQFPTTPELRAEAADLDALADRYEREAA